MTPTDSIKGNPVKLDQNEFLTEETLQKDPISEPAVRQAVINTVEKLDIEKEAFVETLEKEVNKVTTKMDALPKNPRDMLKNIISKGSHKEDVQLFGYTWTMKALDQGEVLLALEDVTDEFTSQAGRVTAMIFAQIVFSIEAINGISIYEWFPEIKVEDYPSKNAYILAVRRGLRVFFKEMAPDVIDEFFVVYNRVDDNRNKAVAELKNS